ncbi:DUF397 domain-containing protein [Streptomyces sp. NPDC059072]|uniref:DUF397 domain-containing protein n=1 Tax=Streptomyces sp. NPDC059072 TaxID=3346715 RepID=UPI0036AB79F7
MNTARTSPTTPALVWRKSTYSGAEGGECIEVATTIATVHIRDSKQLDGPVLTVAPESWEGFLALAVGPQV